jgi:hypothetical protein
MLLFFHFTLLTISKKEKRKKYPLSIIVVDENPKIIK